MLSTVFSKKVLDTVAGCYSHVFYRTCKAIRRRYSKSIVIHLDKNVTCHLKPFLMDLTEYGNGGFYFLEVKLARILLQYSFSNTVL